MSSEDDYSDLDVDLVELARRPCPQQNSKESSQIGSGASSQITLGDDDDDDNTELGDNLGNGDNSGHYGLRRRRTPVSYKNMTHNSDEDDTDNHVSSNHSKKPKRSKPRDVIDLCVLLHNRPTSILQLNKFIKNPEKIESLSKWKIIVNQLQNNGLDDQQHFELVQKFIQKCGRYIDHLILVCDTTMRQPPPSWTRLLLLITNIFKNANFLKKFTMHFFKEESNQEQVLQVLKAIQDSGKKSLNSLQLLSLVGGLNNAVITKEELDIIVKLGDRERGVSWVNVELGDGLLVTEGYGVLKSLEMLLEVCKDTLETLTIHGGLKANAGISEDKSKLTIAFPRKMGSLQELSICPKYSFVSETFDKRNPVSKRWREIRLDDHCPNMDGQPDLTPLKLTLAVGYCDFPKLEKVILGNLVELDECGFAMLRKLTIFRCGSRWDLAVRFPQSESKKGPSELREMQLPDGLKDPSFVQKVGKFFPLLKKVWIYLPSVPVLRTFFKSYENSSSLEELYLKTQFDFETTMESCLLPRIREGSNSLSDSSKTVLSTLREYKHYEDYVRYHNIELPLENADDLEELRRSTTGIRALNSLQVLDLEHIPRTVLIPNPDDERRWYDHNFKFLSTTFGFSSYPFSRSCHQEIVAMNLREYRWKNLYFLDSSTRQFDRAGYVAMDPHDLVSSEEEDLFIPNPNQPTNNNQNSSRSVSQGVKVAIKPSMLIPQHFNKNKIES